MKQIQPITVWSNGQQLQADVLDSYVLHDNLSTQAQFYYGIGVAIDEPALMGINTYSSGQLTMTGQAYHDYQTNQYAWDWVASQLNLTIIGDVTTTTTTTSSTTTETTTETTTLVP
jgi:hypothetical protein